MGAQQRVEIIKALSRDAKILILDEPTAVLTPQETDELIEIMRQLKAGGTSIVFITHKLREVRAIADGITVIRRGRVVGEASPESSESELAGLMVGRDVHLTTDKTDADPGEATFSVRGVTVVDKSESVVVDDVSIDVHRGEILAIAGVDGNGQSELAEAVMGLVEPRSGTISLDGEDLAGLSVKERLRKGIGFVPEDRSTDGVIASFTISENMILDLYDQAPYAKGLSLQPAVVRSEGEKKVGEFDIRLTSIDDPISTLSGGNQQKVVLSRRAGPAAATARRQPAHPRPGRRLDRVRPQADHRRTRLRHTLRHRVHGARRGVQHRRPHRGDVPRSGRRHRAGRHAARCPGSHDGGSAGGRSAGPRRGRLRRNGDLSFRGGPGMTEKTATGQPVPAAPEDAAAPEAPRPILLRSILSGSWMVSVLSIFVGLLAGAVLIAAADTSVQSTLGYFFSRPTDLVVSVWRTVSEAYLALFRGAVFDWQAQSFVRAVRPFTESLVASTPLILAGLGIALGFRSGLFNIGGQGQVILGAIFAGFIGYWLTLPLGLHMLAAIVAGIVGGAIFGAASPVRSRRARVPTR